MTTLNIDFEKRIVEVAKDICPKFLMDKLFTYFPKGQWKNYTIKIIK
jgi:hypothetical protein